MVTSMSMAEWAVAVHDEQGFLLRHPADWKCVQGAGTRPMVLVGPENQGPPTLQASAPRLSDLRGTDLDAYLLRRLDALRRVLTDLRLLDETNDQVGGVTGRRLLFSYRQGIYLLNLVDWTAHGCDRTLTLSGVCMATDYGRTEPVFQAVASSVCFTEARQDITR